MKKYLLLTLLVLLCCLGTACRPAQAGEFSLYLVDGLTTAEAVQGDLQTLPLAAEPLLTAGDIKWYDFETHEMELTRAAYKRIQGVFPMPVRVDGIPFVVRAGEETVYMGAFWTPVSSLSFDGVVIMEPWEKDVRVIRIGVGYPTSDFAASDPRSDPRIRQALETDGVSVK